MLAATYILVFGGWVIINKSPSPTIQAIQGTGELLAIILSFALSWIGIKRRHTQQSQLPHQSFRRWVPLTLSLALLFQIIGNVLYVYERAENQLLFLTGSLVPINLFPGWLEAIAKTLPTSQGIIVLRSVTLQGQSLAQVWLNGSLSWLIVNTSLYLGIGSLIFKLCERYAKQLGSLGQY